MKPQEIATRSMTLVRVPLLITEAFFVRNQMIPRPWYGVRASRQAVNNCGQSKILIARESNDVVALLPWWLCLASVEH